MDSARDRLTTVAVQPSAALAARPRLFAALEAAFPVAFEPAGEGAAGAGAILTVCEEDTLPSHESLTRSGLPTLAIGAAASGAAPARFAFGEGGGVDRRLRGISATDPVDGPRLGTPGAAEEVLASSRSGPAWTGAPGPAPVHRVRSSLPELEPEQGLRDLFDGHALTVVALAHFLRTLAGEGPSGTPKLRAAFLFDDPNLRWRTYGFIDYRRLLDHADAHGYHAAMAMIPLDGRCQHRSTVELFRRRPDRLSLVLHGNNHVSRELMRPADDAEAAALAAQALRRAARFEAHYGLAIDRVMTPPHGMCSESVARALAALGYDALCAIHPYPWTERAPADRPLAGWEAAEFAGGCAVIPRLPMTSDPAEIAWRAFLGQPLVLYGHHDDLSGGLDLLADTASRVNRLGEVEWMSLGEIATSNHSSELDGGLLRVRPYSQRMRVEVPAGAESLAVEAPRGAERLRGWSANGSPDLAFGTATACRPGSTEIRLRPQAGIDATRVPAPPPSLWPVLRRVATESRDRLRPLLQAGPA